MSGPPLLLVAHGSRDPRFGRVVDGVAARVAGLRPGLDVRVGYLEHGPPHVRGVATGSPVAVPLLLTRGYHALRDLPAQAPGIRIAGAVGPDPLLADALAARLAEAGYDGTGPVTLAAAGSADAGALDDARQVGRWLAQRLGVDVTTAFVSAGEPRLAALAPTVVATYLLAEGAFDDAVRACGAPVVAPPLGDHPLLARIVLDRYDDGIAPTAR